MYQRDAEHRTPWRTCVTELQGDGSDEVGHNRSMATAQVVHARREVLLDERGDALQATWHPRRRLVVLSEWRSGICRATFHLDPGDAARLATFLVGALTDAATSPPVVQRPRSGLLDRIRSLLRLSPD
jgi:hypothetical protein